MAPLTWIWACIRAWDVHVHQRSAPTNSLYWVFLAPLLLGLHTVVRSDVLRVRIFAACLGFFFAEDIAALTVPRHTPLTTGLGIFYGLMHVWMTVVLLSIPVSALSRARRNPNA